MKIEEIGPRGPLAHPPESSSANLLVNVYVPDIIMQASLSRSRSSSVRINHHYRPQTKFAKVMFLQVSVILSTGGACMVALGGLHGCPEGGVCVVALGACVVAERGVCGCSGVCVVALGGMHGCSGGRAVALGACMVARGAFCGFWGACIVAWGGVWLLRGRHAWLLPGGGMCGCSGGAFRGCLGVCMVAWGACMVAPGGACMVAPGGYAWLLPGSVAAPGGACVVALGGRAWFFRWDTVNERAVRILLECILVRIVYYQTRDPQKRWRKSWLKSPVSSSSVYGDRNSMLEQTGSPYWSKPEAHIGPDRKSMLKQTGSPYWSKPEAHVEANCHSRAKEECLWI